ncbi:MAG: formylglycine-generating enzyme family protein, partial [Sediminispirochaetaceae bacterium]
LSCPDDMVLIPANPDLGIDCPFCIDKYEASRPDATDTSYGVDNSMAVSRAGVIPWYVNPMNEDAFGEMKTASAAAGKRLCTAAEWTAACSGTSGLTYAFGNVFDPFTCNCIDSFCAEYCDDVGIPDGECDTDTNCGYNYYLDGVNVFHIAPTGSFTDCRSGQGVFDLNGNVWEIVISPTDPRGYEIRGGSFNEANAASRLQCSFNANWQILYAGFRCCRDAE